MIVKGVAVLSIAILLCCCAVKAQTYFESVGGGVTDGVRNFTISEDSTNLIVVGKFGWTRADTLRANGIAQWNGVSWDVGPFGNGSGDTAVVGYENIPVLSVVTFHDTLFVSFLGSPWHYDDAIHGTAFLVNDIWYPCGNPSSLNNVLLENNRLFTGSQIDTVANLVAHGIHEWLGGEWRELPNSPISPSAGIYASAYWHDQYYFAGIFLALGSRKVVAFDGDSTWSPLGTGIVGSHLNCIEGYGDSLYVGGFFQAPTRHIVYGMVCRWKPFFPEVEYVGQVQGLKAYDGALYIKGIYHFVGDNTMYGILRWDGHTLCALGGPYDAESGLAFEVFQGDLYNGMAPTYAPLYQQYIAKLPLENIVPFACVVPSLVGRTEIEPTSGELSIFPNPASNSVNVSFPGGVMGQRIELSNALGQLVVSQLVTGFNTPFSLVGVAPGVYQVTAFSKEGRYLGRLVVE